MTYTAANVYTPIQLDTILRNRFPPDATEWSSATDELRDLHRLAREYAGADERSALDFRALKTPSEWNSRGVTSIVVLYAMMPSDHTRALFLNDHAEWFELWSRMTAPRKTIR